jgi:hypothetical protein
MASSTRLTHARALCLPVFAAALLAAGCSGTTDLDSAFSSISAPFSGSRNMVASDSLTVQRIRGTNPNVDPIIPEPGNVWPEPEAPRPTLMSGPEEAMRDIPSYRPGLIEGAPPAVSPVQSPQERRGLPRGSSTPPGQLGAPQEPGRFQAQPPFASPTPPPPRPEGQVTTDPSGRPAITTGQAGRVRGFTQPGVGGGAVVRDGNVETWIGPDGQARTRVVPQ